MYSPDDPFRILLAEDNPINQRVARIVLERAGFPIDIVNDGSEAVAAHVRTPYHLILMDCLMPSLDGIQATRQIRELNAPQPIIVALTANAMPGHREQCLNAGMDDYASKPYTADKLQSIVRKYRERATTLTQATVSAENLIETSK